jgi:hypothetical protein
MPMAAVSLAGVVAGLAVDPGQSGDARGALETLLWRGAVFGLVVVTGGAALLWSRRAVYFGAPAVVPVPNDP